jgi:predicted acyltransferase
MPSPRLASVDALRGLTVAAMLVVNDAGDWSHVHPWLEHAEWHGIAPPDLIFPLFLFIVGVSVALALVPRVEQGADTPTLMRAVLWRSLRIFLLGLALHAIAWWLMQHGSRPLRVMGVLQRIGLCYLAVGWIALHLRSSRSQWVVLALLTGGYAVLLSLGGSLAPWQNLPDRVDTWVLGSHAYQVDAATGSAHDPEGLLSTLPSIATALLGLRAGTWLRAQQRRRLVAGGVIAILAGLLWSLWQPLNKNLWTPSFVCWTGGVAMLLLALAHELVDRRGWPALGRSLGVNAIAAYAAAWVAICVLAGSGALAPLYAALFAAPLASLPPWVPSAAFAFAFSGVFWLTMRVFDAKGWRITI